MNLAGLRTTFRSRLDDPSARSWLDTMVDTYINEAMRDVRDEIDGSSDRTIRLVSHDVLIAADTESTSLLTELGSEFEALRGVWCLGTDGTSGPGDPLQAVQWDEAQGYGDSNIAILTSQRLSRLGMWTSQVYSFNPATSTVMWGPKIQVATYFRFLVVPPPTTLRHETDIVVDVPVQAHILVALRAALTVKGSVLGEDTRLLQRDYDRRFQQARDSYTKSGTGGMTINSR